MRMIRSMSLVIRFKKDSKWGVLLMVKFFDGNICLMSLYNIMR